VTEGDFSIRRAREEDIPAAVELFGLLDRFQRPWRVFEPRPDLGGEAEAHYRAALDPAEPYELVVAEAGDRLVGIALGHALAPSSMSDERAVEVSSVVVTRSGEVEGSGGRCCGGWPNGPPTRRSGGSSSRRTPPTRAPFGSGGGSDSGPGWSR